MPCPVCGNDVWADAPHICPQGFVAPAKPTMFYGYNSTNQCCREWMLLGWRKIELRRMRVDCPKCGKDLWFDLAYPDQITVWDERTQGKPQPPAIVGGRIRGL